jgi:hypothetical protein
MDLSFFKDRFDEKLVLAARDGDNEGLWNPAKFTMVMQVAASVGQSYAIDQWGTARDPTSYQSLNIKPGYNIRLTSTRLSHKSVLISPISKVGISVTHHGSL